MRPEVVNAASNRGSAGCVLSLVTLGLISPSLFIFLRQARNSVAMKMLNAQVFSSLYLNGSNSVTDLKHGFWFCVGLHTQKQPVVIWMTVLFGSRVLAI